MPFFSTLPEPARDPIFAIAALAAKAGPGAINCTFGVLMDEDGQVSLFPSVKKAITDVGLAMPLQRFSYPPLLGLPAFRSSVHELMFGKDAPYFVASIATTGGTGALAMNLRLMKQMLKSGRLILPMPAWANHPPPALAAGFEIIEAPYLEDGAPSLSGISDAIKKEKGDIGLLIQVGSHNPTGLDFALDQWKELIALLKNKPCIVLLDCAYQGLKDVIEKETEQMKLFIDSGITTLITWSAAKNHTIYACRAGLAAAIVPDANTQEIVEGHYSKITRQLHSAASITGQAIVARTQEAYKEEWLQDLERARANVSGKRAKLVELLPPSFKKCLSGFGMFAMLPLSVPQIQRLMDEYKVYMTFDGRINIAGVPDARIAEFCEKVGKVL